MSISKKDHKNTVCRNCGSDKTYMRKVRKLKVLSIELDNYGLKFDVSIDKEYNTIQVKLKKPYYGDWKVVTGVYGLVSVLIPKSGHSQWERFKIGEKCYNDAYRNLMEYLKDKEFFGIDDIKIWMESE